MNSPVYNPTTIIGGILGYPGTEERKKLLVQTSQTESVYRSLKSFEGPYIQAVSVLIPDCRFVKRAHEENP